MTFNDPIFKAFNEFCVDDISAQADISRRMLRRLEDVDNATTAGIATPAAARGPATSAFAHADPPNLQPRNIATATRAS